MTTLIRGEKKTLISEDVTEGQKEIRFISFSAFPNQLDFI